MAAIPPCRWCASARGIVMNGEEGTGIVICPCCDYARPLHAGPPIPADLIRDPEAKP